MADSDCEYELVTDMYAIIYMYTYCMVMKYSFKDRFLIGYHYHVGFGMVLMWISVPLKYLVEGQST